MLQTKQSELSEVRACVTVKIHMYESIYIFLFLKIENKCTYQKK